MSRPQESGTLTESETGSTSTSPLALDSLGRAIDQSPDLFFLLDEDGHVLFSNHPLATADSSGLNVVGSEWMELVRSASLRVFETGAPEHFGMGEMGPGGSNVWYECHASPVMKDGKVRSSFVACIDITAHKKLEERLRRSEALMVDTQGTAHLGTWDWDLSEPTAVWSAELYRIYGLTPETYTPSYEGYLKMVHPDDRERVMKATDGVFNHNIPYSHDERIFRPDGSMRYLHTWAHPVLDENGKLVKLIGVCQDITEQKLAEERLRASETRMRTLFEQSPLGIVTLDLEAGEILEANQALQEMLSRPGHAIVGHRLDDLVGEDAGEESTFERLVEGSAAERQVDVPLIRADGETVWTRVSLSIVPWSQGTPPFAIATVEDITVRKRADEAAELAALRLEKIGELEEVSEWKSQLLNIASHELRNPLTPMKIQLHLLRQRSLGELTPRQEKAVNVVYREADRLGRLVHDVLDVARLQANRLAIEREPLDLAPLVEDVVESFREAAREWNIGLAMKVDSSLRVDADPDRLKQVLFNILGNALKFTPAGSSVRLVASLHGADVEVSVQDEGPGLTSDQMARLFLPFSQVHEPRAGKTSGSGLGLYIAKAIVKAHGGRIGVTSRGPGRGAVFRFTIPAA